MKEALLRLMLQQMVRFVGKVNQAEGQSLGDRVRGVGCVEARSRRLEVKTHRIRTNRQDTGDILVGFAKRFSAQATGFARRQANFLLVKPYAAGT